MDRTQKKQVVENLGEVLSSASSAIVVHYRGLTVAEMTKFRKKARELGVGFKVTKNTLARLASNDSEFKVLNGILKGPTGIAYSSDPASAAKVVVQFNKENEKLKIIGGAFDGKLLDEAGVKTLATMPTLDESRSILIGLINAPATRLAGLINTSVSQVARVIGAHASQKS